MSEPNSTTSLRLLVGVGLLSAVAAAVGVTAARRAQPDPQPTPAPVAEVAVANGATPHPVVTIPAGYHMSSVSAPCPPDGHIGPGDRADVRATLRIGGVPQTVTVLQDVLVLAIEGRKYLRGNWVPKSLGVCYFAVNREQALILEGARTRGAVLMCALLPTEAGSPRPPQDLDATAKLFEEPQEAKPLVVAPVPPPVLPKGTQAFALECAQVGSSLGYMGPGARVDLVAMVRSGKKTIAFPAVVNVLIVAVDTQTSADGMVRKETVTFAVDKAQATVLTLAMDRRCALTPMLRSPEAGDTDDGYDIKKVTELLTGLPSAALPVAPPPRAVVK